MTLNDAFVKHNFISKILLKSDDAELPKTLKVKVMSMRLELSKIKSAFERDLKSIVENLKPEGYDALAAKEGKNEEEAAQLNQWNADIKDGYDTYLTEKSNEELDWDGKFTEEEYFELVDVNSGNDVEINGTKLKAADFLEIIYSLFVE